MLSFNRERLFQGTTLVFFILYLQCYFEIKNFVEMGNSRSCRIWNLFFEWVDKCQAIVELGTRISTKLCTHAVQNHSHMFLCVPVDIPANKNLKPNHINCFGEKGSIFNMNNSPHTRLSPQTHWNIHSFS